MCLSYLKDFDIIHKIGWQVKRVTKEGKLFPLFMGNIGDRYSLGKWYMANPKTLAGDMKARTYKGEKKLYFAGFHVFLSKKDAIEYMREAKYRPVAPAKVALVKCKIKGVVATGIQRFINKKGWTKAPTVVSTKIKYEEVVEGT